MQDWDDERIDEGPDEADADLLDEDHIELVPCPHCGAMISELAQQCPECKYWITPKNTSALAGRPVWWVVLAVLGIIMFILIYALW